MGDLTAALVLGNAAWREAARTRDPEMDVDHVLCALVAAGGPAARLLGERRVTLSGLRAAVRAVQAEDLAVVGVDAARLGRPRVRPTSDLHHEAVGELAPTARAMAVLGGTVGSHLEVLGRLLEEPSGLPRRILARAGVEPDELTAVIAAMAATRPTRERRFRRVPVSTGLIGQGRSRAWATDHYIACPPGLVVEVAGDPEVAATWFVDEAQVVSPRVVSAPRRPGSTGRPARSFVRVDPLVEAGHRVAWQVRMDAPRRGLTDTVTGYYDVRADPAPGGSVVTIAQGWRQWGLAGPLAIRVTGLFARMGAWRLAQELAFACADRQPG